MRFDDKTNRPTNEKFSPIREIWNKFIENSQSCFIPYKQITIDEQLLPCKLRCSFIQYMPNKPDQLGIKFWLLCDLKTKYTCNAFPYSGADQNKQANF